MDWKAFFGSHARQLRKLRGGSQLHDCFGDVLVGAAAFEVGRLLVKDVPVVTEDDASRMRVTLVRVLELEVSKLDSQ